MRILVTGANGFVGRHLEAELLGQNHEVLTSDWREPATHIADITNSECVADMIRSLQPDAVVNLAGIAHVGQAKAQPKRTVDVNLGGVVNLLEACRHHAPRCKLLFITSAQVYGQRSGEDLIHEDDPLKPANFYAAIKTAADMTARQYGVDHDLHVMIARPQNHTGPGQMKAFVTPSFARGVVEQRQHGDSAKPLQRGNLDSVKNFTDVRDIVRGYRLLLERGQAGKAYNLASDRHVQIREVLEGFYKLAGIHPNHVRHDPYWRPTDTAPRLSTDRISTDTGWAPKISFEQTLEDIFREAEASCATNGD